MSTLIRSVIGAATGLLAGVAAFEWRQAMMGNQLVIGASLVICTLTGWGAAQKLPTE